MSLFLDLLEKQLTFLKVEDSKWLVYHIGYLPNGIFKLIAKESSDDAQNYDKVEKNSFCDIFN